MKQHLRLLVCLTLIGGLAAATLLPLAQAFNGRDLILLNMVLPILQAGWRAHQTGHPVGPALLQAAVGGLILQKGFEQSIKAGQGNALQAWRTKFLVNLGASLAESAGCDRFTFRMDIGPIWVLADRDGILIRPGLHACIAPLINLSEGAKFDWSASLKFGTMAFHRSQRQDGTISQGGALAYSNANNFITNPYGSHTGHELVHTFQYRRDTFLIPGFTKLLPDLRARLGPAWVDDTGWFVNWITQTGWADNTGRSKDFDILLEREAYYLEQKYLY